MKTTFISYWLTEPQSGVERGGWRCSIAETPSLPGALALFRCLDQSQEKRSQVFSATRQTRLNLSLDNSSSNVARVDDMLLLNYSEAALLHA